MMAEAETGKSLVTERQNPDAAPLQPVSAIKSILLLLGESAASISARTYAFALAQQTGARLSGIAGIDLSFIEARMPGVAGGTAWKFRLEDQLRKQADDIRHRLHDTFERESVARHMALDWLSFEGDPVETLQMAVETRDLIVTGHDTAFHGSIRDRAPEMLSQLLSMTPRPVVVCPDDLPEVENVLVACDGSAPSMRAIQLFSLLGLARGKRILVTAIDGNQELAVRRVSGAVTYLRNHDYEVEANPIASDVHPSEVLRGEIADRRIGTLVMGAYGHRGFREFLFGSTTTALVEDPPCCLFICN